MADATPATMRAVVYDAAGPRGMQMTELPVPTPGPNQARARAAAVTLATTQQPAAPLEAVAQPLRPRSRALRGSAGPPAFAVLSINVPA